MQTDDGLLVQEVQLGSVELSDSFISSINEILRLEMYIHSRNQKAAFLRLITIEAHVISDLLYAFQH